MSRQPITEPKLRYQVKRQRIINGVKHNSGAFVTADDIPDHEWGNHQRSDDFHPPLPRRKPQLEPVTAPKPVVAPQRVLKIIDTDNDDEQ